MQRRYYDSRNNNRSCDLFDSGSSNTYRSTKPVAFYSGEKPPKERELSDVFMWNKKHGKMWIWYGIVIMVSYVLSIPLLDSIWCVIPMCGGTILPIPVMIWYHNKLIRMYKK